MKPPSTTRKSNWPPDYRRVFKWRQQQLMAMRDDVRLAVGAKEYYARPENAAAFINHWVDTFDPRRTAKGLPARLPLILFPRQEDFVYYILALIDGEEDGLVEKCRDMGATWVAVAVSVWLWLFKAGATVGWGSRKQELVDRLGVPDSIFEKIRMVIRGLPPEFLPLGFSDREHMTFMKVLNPESGSAIVGEVGDNIGRGGRSLVYFKDESAHYARPELIEAALSDNTRCQIDISSVNGLGNVFHRKREAGVEYVDGEPEPGRVNVFVMDWRDHPEKNQAWYDRRKRKAYESGLMAIFAQEVDRDYSASREGVLIPAEHIRAAIDIDKVLRRTFTTGSFSAGLDVADGGTDRNALSMLDGSKLVLSDAWERPDVGKTTRRAIELLDQRRLTLQYDCIGIGSGVKAEVNRLSEEGLLWDGISFQPWNAGAAVMRPTDRLVDSDDESPTFKEVFHNLKAQAWWDLARRLRNTFLALSEGRRFKVEDMICLSGRLPKLRQLEKELGQVTVTRSSASFKVMIEKSPSGTRSPNLADSLVMAAFPYEGDANANFDLLLATKKG